MIGGLAVGRRARSAYAWWAPLVLAGAWLATHWLLRESAVWRDRNTDEVRERAARRRLRVPAGGRPAGGQGAAAVRPRRLDDRALHRPADAAASSCSTQATRLRERPLVWSLLLVVGRQRRSCSGRWPTPRPAAASISGSSSSSRSAPSARRMIAFGGLNWALDGAAAPVGRGAAARAGDGAGRRARRAGRRAGGRACRRARSVSATSRSPIPSGARRCSTASTSRFPPARRSPSSARTAPARRRWPSCCAGSTTRSPARSRSTASTCASSTSTSWRSRVDRGVPGLHPLRAAAARQRRARPARPTTVIAGRSSRRRRRRTWPASTPCSRAATRAAPTSRAASGSASRWRARLCAVRLGAGVVLLDEPTAQLDVRGEAEIFDRILAATRHCTTILISHRFSTVRHADRICVLEHGRVVELGTHDELMALGGRYRTMFDLQAQRFARRGRGGSRAMTSSPDARSRATTCRPRSRRCGALCKLGYRHEPGLIVVAFVLALLAALPDALLALWFKLLGEGVARARPARCVRLAARRRSASRPTATWFLRTVSTRVQRRFRDKVTIALESHVARLQASVATIAHQERPDYLDRLAVLRDQVFVLDHMYMSLFSTCGWILRLGVTVALLMSIHPALALLARVRGADGADLDVAAGRRARREERGAPSNRLARHLFDDRDDRAAGQGSARHRHRRAPGRASAARRGSAGTRRSRAARWAIAPRGTPLAWAVFGAGVRRRDRVRVVGRCARRRRRAAGARGRVAAVGVHRRDGGRDRVPARRLDGRLAAPGVARGLRRRRSSRRADLPVPARLDRRHPLRARLVRLSRHRAARARRREPRPAGRRGRRDRRRERRREDARS